MLDNPDLSSDKMIEVMARGTEIIGFLMILLIALLIYIYRYEIGLILKQWFSNSKNDFSPLGISTMMKTDISELEEKDFRNKVDNLLNKFANPILDDDGNEILKNIDDGIKINTEDNPPTLSTLKTIRNSNEITCYFVNDGGIISDLRISSIDNIKITIEPQSIIKPKESGYLKLEIENSFEENEIHFELTFCDYKNNYQLKKYLYSLVENKWL